MKLSISFEEDELDVLHYLVKYAASVITKDGTLNAVEERVMETVTESRDTFKRLKPGRSRG